MSDAIHSAARLLATCFGCGLAPVAPGTAGSAAALLVAAGLHYGLDWSRWQFAVLALLALPAAVWAAGAVAARSGSDDPGEVVIDEVVGQWAALAGATSYNWKSWLAAVLLFRLFDIWKPFPVRRLERLPGGAGIVADDLAAGLLAALVLAAAGWFNLY